MRKNKLGKENALTITYQAKLKPNQEARKQLQFISQGCNAVYNWALTKRIKTDKQRLKQPSKFQQAKDLTDLKKQTKYQWLNQIPAWTLREVVINRASNAWKKYETRKELYSKAKYPREKTDKGWHDSFSIHQEGYQIKDNCLFLSQGNYKGKRQPQIIIPFELTNPLKGTSKIITISFKRDSWTLNIACDIELPPQMPLSEIKKILGIDRGVRKILATSKGLKLLNPKYWEKVEKRYIEFQRSLSKKVKGSNNWKKTKGKMKRLGEKTGNRMKDLCHKTSRELVDNSDLLVLEKLETKKMISKENKKVGKWTRDGMMKACWSQLAFFIIYKAMGAGKWYLFVSPRNTSKRCSDCGEINKELRDEEVFVCPWCDYQEDRDVNAAKNIQWKAQIKLGLPTG